MNLLRRLPRTGLMLAAALALMLPGCSGGTGTQPLFPQLLAAAQKSAAIRRARKAGDQRPPLTRAALDTLDGSYLEVTLERNDVLAYLFVSAVQRDALPGEIVQWRTEDNVTLTTRNGVLIATRGLGGDIVSSRVNVAEGRPGPVSGGERALFIRTGDLAEARLTLACDLVDLGAETIEIVERAHAVRHLQERCTDDRGGQVRYDYWVDSRSGIVWQSRQWGGPHIGYLTTRRLTTG